VNQSISSQLPKNNPDRFTEYKNNVPACYLQILYQPARMSTSRSIDPIFCQLRRLVRTVNGLAPVLSEHHVSAWTLSLVTKDPGVNNGRGAGLTTSSG
jgi:hypothetical protein